MRTDTDTDTGSDRNTDPGHDTVAGVTFRLTDHHQGPDGVVNGGWAAGLTAGLLSVPPGQPVEVTLHAPVPLEQPVHGDPRGALLSADGTVLTRARLVDTIAAPPPFVPLADVPDDADSGADHPFPRCFVCGPQRPSGLKVAVARIDGDLFAGVWRPPQPGVLPARYLWAVLDCPTGWVHFAPGERAVLGRLTVVLHGTATGGEPYVVVARADGAERRKRHSTAALYTTGGVLVGSSAAVWITI